VYWASRHFLSHARGKVMVLMYHRVLPRAELSEVYVQPAMYVTPDTFERHLRFVRTYFEVLSFRELLHNWSAGTWDASARYCVLTFDDGWLDNYLYAFPLLRKYELSATVFLPTALVGSTEPFWTDRLGDLLRRQGTGGPAEWDARIEGAKLLDDERRDRLIDRLAAEVGEASRGARRYVNWQEVREMSRFGIAFGSHSMTHANLTRLDQAALDRELRGSLDVLRSHDGVDWVPVLAYPNGDHTGAIAVAARAAGFAAAVTTRPGLETKLPADVYRLKRVAMHDDVSRSIPVMTFQIARAVRAWSL
jgi:peptidoglycan/xylan/chitin deacetylase (PgdA/CDA1 family)